MSRVRKVGRQRALFGVLLASALALGGFAAWVDSRPTWDDAGVTVGALLILSGCFGAIRPSVPWLWALAIGAWIPIVEILKSGNLGSLVALPVVFVGAYAGALARRLLFPRA